MDERRVDVGALTDLQKTGMLLGKLGRRLGGIGVVDAVLILFDRQRHQPVITVPLNLVGAAIGPGRVRIDAIRAGLRHQKQQLAGRLRLTLCLREPSLGGTVSSSGGPVQIVP